MFRKSTKSDEYLTYYGLVFDFAPPSVGMMIGFVMCNTLFSLISSAVNTVIVCYAEAPREFEQNYPQLSEQMRVSWRQAYPQEFNY